MVEFEKIQEFVLDKRVIIVGNGHSLLDKENGDKIDSFDIVVRMNHGYVRNELVCSTGIKTDLWVCAYLNKIFQAKALPLFAPKYVLRFNNRDVHDNLNSILYTWDFNHLYSFKRELNINGANMWPSTGIVTLHFF